MSGYIFELTSGKHFVAWVNDFEELWKLPGKTGDSDPIVPPDLIDWNSVEYELTNSIEIMCNRVIQVYIEFDRKYENGELADELLHLTTSDFFIHFEETYEKCEMRYHAGSFITYYARVAPGDPNLVCGILVELSHMCDHGDDLPYRWAEKLTAELYRNGPKYWLDIVVREK